MDLAACIKAYDQGRRDPAVLHGIASYLTQNHAVLTGPGGEIRTALHFFGELFAAHPALRQAHRHEQVAAMTFSPHVPGDGVSAADVAWAFANPGGRARALVRYVREFVTASDAGAALTRLLSGMPLADLLPRLAGDEALLALLGATPVEDWQLEQGLTALRRELLKPTVDPAALPLAVALALQCHLTEFILEETPEDRHRVEALVEQVRAGLRSGFGPSPLAVAMVAAHRRLGEVLPELKAWLATADPALGEIARLHFVEPREEARLAAAMPSLTPIADGTSAAVRAQYERHPYPAWTTARIGHRRPIAELIADNLPHLLSPSGLPDPCSLLIAGCGTGMHAIELASHIRTSRVLAIDLSLRSLAYGQRKARALGLGEIAFAQADIMELGGFGERFDVISSVGTLHHTRDMRAAWRVLRRLLAPRGLMQIGLYSRIGRDRIEETRQLIRSLGLESTDEAMRAFRRRIMTERPDLFAMLATDPAFYSLSELRDLVFHVQETQHDLPEISDILDELDLEFLGLHVHPEVRARYRETFPEDPAMISIANWHQFEIDNPGTFTNMYQLWARSRR
jgi:SAM-dependent methyltransferase